MVLLLNHPDVTHVFLTNNNICRFLIIVGKTLGLEHSGWATQELHKAKFAIFGTVL